MLYLFIIYVVVSSLAGGYIVRRQRRNHQAALIFIKRELIDVNPWDHDDQWWIDRQIFQSMIKR